MLAATNSEMQMTGTGKQESSNVLVFDSVPTKQRLDELVSQADPNSQTSVIIDFDCSFSDLFMIFQRCRELPLQFISF